MKKYIFAAIQLILTVAWYFTPTPEGVVTAIAPLAIAAIGAGLSIGSSFLRGNTTTSTQTTSGLDRATILRILNQIRQIRSSGFVPDQAAFEAQSDAEIDEIFGRANLNAEQLEAEFASRGTNVSPGTIGALVSEVRAPAARAAASSRANAAVNFQNLKTQGLSAQEGLINQLMAILAGGSPQTINQTTQGPNQGLAKAGEFGDFLFEFGLFDQFGLFGEDPVGGTV